MKTIAIAAALFLSVPMPSMAAVPDCAGPGDWPALMALSHLKDARITDDEKVDFSKTRVLRLASEPKGTRLHRQLHLIAFAEKSGQVINVITVHDASAELCSESPVEVYLISRKWGGA
jgi:hypothetical protein